MLVAVLSAVATLGNSTGSRTNKILKEGLVVSHGYLHILLSFLLFARSLRDVSLIKRGTQPSMVNELSEVNPLLAAKEIILRKKMISMIEHYDVEDRKGTKIGEAEGNLFQIRPKFVVKDINDSKLMYIEGKTFSVRREFSFYDNAGKFLGTMKNKLLKLRGQEYRLERNGTELMRIFGNFTGLDYQMEINGVQVATVHKKLFSMRDKIRLSITGETVDHRIVLGALIVIEHIEVTKRSIENS